MPGIASLLIALPMFRNYSSGSDREGLRRDVAQSGSAPEWGSGGRGFKSRRPDFTPSQRCWRGRLSLPAVFFRSPLAFGSRQSRQIPSRRHALAALLARAFVVHDGLLSLAACLRLAAVGSNPAWRGAALDGTLTWRGFFTRPCLAIAPRSWRRLFPVERRAAYAAVECQPYMPPRDAKFSAAPWPDLRSRRCGFTPAIPRANRRRHRRASLGLARIRRAPQGRCILGGAGHRSSRSRHVRRGHGRWSRIPRASIEQHHAVFYRGISAGG